MLFRSYSQGAPYAVTCPHMGNKAEELVSLATELMFSLSPIQMLMQLCHVKNVHLANSETRRVCMSVSIPNVL